MKCVCIFKESECIINTQMKKLLYLIRFLLTVFISSNHQVFICIENLTKHLYVYKLHAQQ